MKRARKKLAKQLSPYDATICHNQATLKESEGKQKTVREFLNNDETLILQWFYEF